MDESYRHNSQPALKAILKLCWSAIVLRVTFSESSSNDLQYFSGGTLYSVHALALHTYTIKEWEGLQDPSLPLLPVVEQEASRKNAFALSALFQYVAKDFMKNGLRAVCFVWILRFLPSIQTKIARECEKIRDSAQ